MNRRHPAHPPLKGRVGAWALAVLALAAAGCDPLPPLDEEADDAASQEASPDDQADNEDQVQTGDDAAAEDQSAGAQDNGEESTADASDGDVQDDAPATCVTDEDCDDGLFCTGVAVCVAETCITESPPCAEGEVCDEETDQCTLPECMGDDDCPNSESCLDGSCTAMADETLADLVADAVTGALVDLTAPIAIGRILRFEAPDPTLRSAGSLLTRAPPLDCGCTWSVEPATAGTWDPADACITEFTPQEVGTATLNVDVGCAVRSVGFSQSIVIADIEPELCATDADCGATQVCEDGACVTPAPPAPSVTLLETRAFAPYVVQLDVRLTDAAGDIIPVGVSASDFELFEDDVPLDPIEAGLFVMPGENLPLRMVLVLDYSLSMAASGAIPAMLDAAEGFIEAAHFTSSHGIGVVAFHDRGEEGDGYSLVAPITSTDAQGKTRVVEQLPGVDALEPGVSRVWDAVDLAIRTLSDAEPAPGEVRAVVFLSDGRDTTSVADPIALASTAQAAGVMLYPIGFGDVGFNQAALEQLAEETGGQYTAAAKSGDLLGAFADLAFDLRGQWRLTYVTPRNTGTVETRLVFHWGAGTAEFGTTFDAGSLEGDVDAGLIEPANRRYDEMLGVTQFDVMLRHVPRNVDRFRFRFARTGATFQIPQDGGLLPFVGDWTATLANDGAYELLGDAALPHAANGVLGVVALIGNVPVLQFEHDDTVYADTPFPKTMSVSGDLWAAGYTLDVSVEPATAGIVTISPDKERYGHGEAVLLTAVPSTGSTFVEWTGDVTGATSTTAIVFDGDKSVVANMNTTDP